MLTKLDHQPAALNAPFPMVCQLELPLASNSVWARKKGGNHAITTNIASGRRRSRQRIVLSRMASKDGRVSSSTNLERRNSRTRVRHLRSILDSAAIKIGTVINRRTFIARSLRNGISICLFHASPCQRVKTSRGSQVMRMVAKALLSTRRRSSPAWPRRTRIECIGPPRVREKFSAMEEWSCVMSGY